MQEFNGPLREGDGLRKCFSELSDAVIHGTGDCDFEVILRCVINGACALTDARYGAIALHEEIERYNVGFVATGASSEEISQLAGLHEELKPLVQPQSLRMVPERRDSAGTLVPAGFRRDHRAANDLLTNVICHRDDVLGSIYVVEKNGGPDFTLHDQENLARFATLAAAVIAGAFQFIDLHRSQSLLETVVDLSPVSLLVVDANGSFQLANRESRRIVRGLRVPGRNLAQLREIVTFRHMDGREIPQEDLPLQRALRTGEIVRAEEVVLNLPDGQEVPTLISARPIFSIGGEVTSAVSVAQDITPLVEAKRLRSETFGAISQKLRVPLATIKGATATVLGDSPSINMAEVRQSLQIIDAQVDYMQSLVRDLLNVTRIEDGRLRLVPELVTVSSLLNDARNAFLQAGVRHTIDILLDEKPPVLRADRERILEVLDNLLSNACNNSVCDANFTLAATHEESDIAISVSDEGDGIPEEQMPLLFDGTSSASRGNGGEETRGGKVNLATCKEIVEAHGGRMWAESAGPGLGAKFTFTLPAGGNREDDAPVETLQLPSGPRPSLSRVEKSRILAIDHDQQMLWHLRKTLSEAGFVPIVTNDPDEMDDLIETEGPHLILLDLIFPDTDGFELMKRIRDVPVIFLSRQGRDQNIARAFDMGASDYIVKPFSDTELVARIRSVLRQRASLLWTDDSEPYMFGDLTINYSQRYVAIGGREVHLTATEYKLLFELSMNAGRVLSHDYLLNRIWRADTSATHTDLRTVRSFIKSLRRKLKDDAKSPTYIFTESRVGYRMPHSAVVASD